MARCSRKPPRLGDAIAETVMPTLPQRSGGACQKTTALGRIGALAGMSMRSRGAEAPAIAAIARARFLSSGPSATARRWTDGGARAAANGARHPTGTGRGDVQRGVRRRHSGVSPI
jgi:hypothetical protein